MAGAGGLLVFGVGVLLGVPPILIALGVLAFASRTERHRAGYIASLIALALAALSVIVTSPITHAVLSGADAHGSLPTSWFATALVCIGIQALTVVGSIANALRHRARRLDAPAPASATVAER